MEKRLEVLEEAAVYIKKLYNGTQNIITSLREGQLKEGYAGVVQLTEGIGWILQAVELTKRVQVRYIDHTVLNGAIINIIDALENQDNKTLADVLEYELLDGLVAMEKEIQYNLYHQLKER